jgi:hypothetical protein
MPVVLSNLIWGKGAYLTFLFLLLKYYLLLIFCLIMEKFLCKLYLGISYPCCLYSIGSISTGITEDIVDIRACKWLIITYCSEYCADGIKL